MVHDLAETEAPQVLIDGEGSARPVVLYDGLCGFCDRTVQFVLARDRSAAIRFAPLQGAFAKQVVSRHPELAAIDSLVFVEHPGSAGEVIQVRSRAALALARHLSWGWRTVARLAALVPVRIGDRLYDAFARRRYRWFGRRETCAVPAPAARERFLD